MSEDARGGAPNDPPPTPKSSDPDDPIAPLTEELRRVAGMRTPKALRDAHLPVLSELLAEPDDADRRLEGLRRLLTDGVDHIGDPQFRAAANALFGFGEHRWTPLNHRGERAAASFNCSFDAYRRARRSTGVSLLDETVLQLARAVRSHVHPTGADPHPVTDASVVDQHPDHVADPATPPRRRKVLLAGVVGAVLVIALIAVVAVVNRRAPGTDDVAAGTTIVPTSAPSTASTSPVATVSADCHEIGATSDPDLDAYGVPFRTQISQLIPPGEPEPCGGSPVTRWDDLVIQPLLTEGVADGALVATDPNHVLLMTQAEFTSYRQIGGKDGTQAQEIAGLPRRRAMSGSGKVWLIVTDHGAMASSGVDQPGYYLGGPVWTGWQANGQDSGEWGVPASNPLNNAVGYYQDFSKGRLTLSYTGTLEFHPVADPAATLPEGFPGQILRHDDGTTWFVDDRSVRHWIPDGETWFCINDAGAREIGDIPGYAITTLELGAPATCPTEP